MKAIIGRLVQHPNQIFKNIKLIMEKQYLKIKCLVLMEGQLELLLIYSYLNDKSIFQFAEKDITILLKA